MAKQDEQHIFKVSTFTTMLFRFLPYWLNPTPLDHRQPIGRFVYASELVFYLACWLILQHAIAEGANVRSESRIGSIAGLMQSYIDKESSLAPRVSGLARKTCPASAVERSAEWDDQGRQRLYMWPEVLLSLSGFGTIGTSPTIKYVQYGLHDSVLSDS